MSDNQSYQQLLDRLVDRAINQGVGATVDEADELAASPLDNDTLCDAADRVRRHWMGDRIDTCAIVNARSGRCSEDCKWCSQSRHFSTGVDTYDHVALDDMLAHLRANTQARTGRFALVTSGRKVSRADMPIFTDMYRRARQESPIGLCASMGLLDREQLQALKDAGVTRYHCNLETSSDLFPTLCSSHSRADKLRTIAAAREVGLEVCSGGIIGMGESMRQRLMLAAEAVAAGACSIPVNLLNPIPGTPLENTPLIPEDEVIRTVALFRLIAPKCGIRFAGGRARVSREATIRMLRGGANGAMVGDMLTTSGNEMTSDQKLFVDAGYTI